MFVPEIAYRNQKCSHDIADGPSLVDRLTAEGFLHGAHDLET